jgi:hypothetical protein
MESRRKLNSFPSPSPSIHILSLFLYLSHSNFFFRCLCSLRPLTFVCIAMALSLTLPVALLFSFVLFLFQEYFHFHFISFSLLFCPFSFRWFQFRTAIPYIFLLIIPSVIPLIYNFSISSKSRSFGPLVSEICLRLFVERQGPCLSLCPLFKQNIRHHLASVC